MKKISFIKPIDKIWLITGKSISGRLVGKRYINNPALIVIIINLNFVASNLIEFDEKGDVHRGTRTDKTNEKEEKINHKPEPVTDQKVEIGNSSKHDGGDYKLATEKKSYTSSYLPS